MRRTKRLLVIGVNSHYGHGVLQGIAGYFQGRGRCEYRFEPDSSPETVARAHMAMRKWRPDGIVACMQAARVEEFAKQSGVPAVNVTGDSLWGGPSVITDCEGLGRMVARHFLNSGFRYFAFSALTKRLSSQRMSAGFSGELLQAGRECIVLQDEFSGRMEEWVRNQAAMSRRLMYLKKPTAILCIYDYRAQELVWQCQQLGLHVPDEIALVGVGNDESLCRMSTPPISSVELDTYRIGYEAARMVDGMTERGSLTAETILVPPRRLVVRQSSDVVAIDDPEIARAMRYIREHAYELITVKDLLRTVSISRRVMELRFVKCVGRTPHAEIMRLKMEQARTLLHTTDLSILEVAVQSGFQGQEVFSMVFRRETGMTPTEYRRTSKRAVVGGPAFG